MNGCASDRVGRIAGALLAFGLLAGPVGADSVIRVVPRSGQTCVVVTLQAALADALGTPSISSEDWQMIFPVRTEEAATADPPGPAIFGSYSVLGVELVFRPRLPFLPETEYRASVDLAALRRLIGTGDAKDIPISEQHLALTFRLPSTAREAPRVVAIHPTSSRVPGNLLRAYVQFSEPMRPDVVSDYLRLVDESGEEVPLPFVEIDGGLWDPQGTRLTLLFHPGRLKRGVAPRELQGPPLDPGNTYRLLIDPGWPSATGTPLSQGASRSWAVGSEDREPVTPDGWQLQPPHAGTDETLEVHFGEALDHALALRLITVLRAGRPVLGAPDLTADDTRWSFRPKAPWVDDEYILRVHPNLEDLAGNNLRGPFDRGEGQVEGAATAIELPFRPTDNGR